MRVIHAKFISSPPGTMIFAHILVPHAPYILNKDCHFAGKPDFPYKLGENYGFSDRGKIVAKRTEQYQRYFGQVKCVFNKLDELFAALDDLGKLDKTTVILQGDHGSRISNDIEILEHLNERDLIDNYATMFSIKSNTVAPRDLINASSLYRTHLPNSLVI